MATGKPTADAPSDEQNDPEPRTDGRAARAARTRAAIVDALLSLLEEGDLQPTANRIAERAGISLRLIYHHFGDLEALFHAAAIRQGERIVQLSTPIPEDLPFAERLDLFVLQRSDILEWMTPVRRASLLQEPFSEELQRARDTFIAVGEEVTAALFAEELALVPRDRRAAVRASMAAASGWNFWDALRTSGRSIDETRAAMRCTLEALLRP
jgi:TetR/AcrR family transcriptional regulator of autoinduction and epiphytic fitness